MTGIRRGQLVLPFGVGAIVEVGQESFVCAELSRWMPEETLALEESELQRITRRPLRTPSGSAPFVRFPRWLFCPACRRMTRLTESREKQLLANGYKGAPKCTNCWEADLTPMGFVQACENGHLDEVDWFLWAHRRQQLAETGQCSRGTAELRFLTTGARGGDWETLLVKCEKCGAQNNLEGLTTRPLPWKCRGRQPWMNQDGQSCDKKPGGHRRGDSNLYFPTTLSAIDIVVEGAAPAAGLREVVEEQFNTGIWQGMRPMFEMVLSTFGAEAIESRLAHQISDLAAARGVPSSVVAEALIATLENRSADPTGDGTEVDLEQGAILRREWPVLARGSALTSKRLIISPRRPGTGWPGGLGNAIQRISLIPRLREVRALLAYRRVDATDGALVPLHANNERSWLPGVEVWGEGIFLQFSEDYLAKWEAEISSALQSRVQLLAAKYAVKGGDPARVTPRFIAIHTFSHMVLRRLAFDAGYSSTALRERVYAGEGMAGILIYTADGDSEGSLGGLVRMGEPNRIIRTIVAALNDASWCSADPVCGETRSQGTNGMNGAACHACSLVAETSCVHGNQLLDRHFVLKVGDGRIEHGLLAVPPVQEQ